MGDEAGRRMAALQAVNAALQAENAQLREELEELHQGEAGDYAQVRECKWSRRQSEGAAWASA